MTEKSKIQEYKRRAMILVATGILSAVTFVGTSAATDNDFCESDLVENVLEPIFTAIFQIGPLLAAIAGIASLLMMSQVTSKDKKQKWKERRNDAFLYGVIGILIIGFILDFIINFVIDVGDGDDCLNAIDVPGFGGSDDGGTTEIVVHAGEVVAHGTDVVVMLV